MDNPVTENKSKPKAKPVKTVAIRVKSETKKRILQEVAKLNKKDFGRRLGVDDLIALAISLVEPQHTKSLQDTSLSNADRLERDYRAYIAKHGPISKDSYLGKRLNGELSAHEVVAGIEPHKS